jgi:hypothetical protein
MHITKNIQVRKRNYIPGTEWVFHIVPNISPTTINSVFLGKYAILQENIP